MTNKETAVTKGFDFLFQKLKVMSEQGILNVIFVELLL